MIQLERYIKIKISGYVASYYQITWAYNMGESAKQLQLSKVERDEKKLETWKQGGASLKDTGLEESNSFGSKPVLEF